MTHNTFAIDTSDLRKSYDGVEALRGLSLQVPAGSIFGFLGRNGAGKTTTIKILLGLAQPTGGTARVFGLACDTQASSVEIRRRTGFVSDEKDLIEQMTVEAIVRFTRIFYPGGARTSSRNTCASSTCRCFARSSSSPAACARNWPCCSRFAAARSC